jgi:hypothetical protein
MDKPMHVNCFLVEVAHAEAFRNFVDRWNEPNSYEEHQQNNYELMPPSVEIIYEEENKSGAGFDLWFATHAIAFYFGRAWAMHVQELDKLDKSIGPLATAGDYPKFLYLPKSRTWLRYNTPEYFCIVSDSQLQVRRERPQELFKPDEVEVGTEAAFLAAYQRIRAMLQDQASALLSTYQRRGSEGNEWFYANPIYAAAPHSLERHLRLNVSASDYGRSWQLMYSHDTNRNDPRRVASTQQEFERQLHLMLREMEAVATGKQEGGQGNG